MEFAAVVILIFLAGATWGSFLGVIALRAPQSLSWIRGRSVCDRCAHVLGVRDLIPLFSFLELRGRCRYCGATLSYFYVAIEAVTGILFLLGAYQFDDLFSMLAYIVVISFFIVLFVTDVRGYVIPDLISLPGIACVFIVQGIATNAWVSLAWGGIFGAAWFLIQYLISGGRWVGSGDIRVGALLGVLLGHMYIWLGLGIAYVGGSLVALALIAARRKTLQGKLPFATLLLPAAFSVWLWGADMWAWYMRVVLGF